GAGAADRGQRRVLRGAPCRGRAAGDRAEVLLGGLAQRALPLLEGAAARRAVRQVTRQRLGLAGRGRGDGEDLLVGQVPFGAGIVHGSLSILHFLQPCTAASRSRILCEARNRCALIVPTWRPVESAISGIDISSKCFMTKIDRCRGESASRASRSRSRISRPAARRSGDGDGCAAASSGEVSSSSSRAGAWWK